MVRLTAVIIAAALPEQLGALPRGPTPRGGSTRPRPHNQRGQLPHDRDLRESNTTKTAAVAAGLAFPVVSLLCFHLRLAAISQTTNESVRGVYRHAINSNDKGCRRNCMNSIYATLREATPPSRLEPLFARPCADQSWGAYGAVRSDDVA